MNYHCIAFQPIAALSPAHKISTPTSSGPAGLMANALEAAKAPIISADRVIYFLYLSSSYMHRQQILKNRLKKKEFFLESYS